MSEKTFALLKDNQVINSIFIDELNLELLSAIKEESGADSAIILEGNDLIHVEIGAVYDGTRIIPKDSYWDGERIVPNGFYWDGEQFCPNDYEWDGQKFVLKETLN